MNYQEAKEKLEKYGQEHLLKFYDRLSVEQKQSLLGQINELDMSMLSMMNEENHQDDCITPLSALELKDIEQKKEEYYKIGVSAIKNKKVGAVLLAGGQGTRLGVEKSKAMVNIGVTRTLYIMECIINNLLDVVKETDTWVPLFIMTSEKNNDCIIEFLEEKNYFGYKKEMVYFFIQEMNPTISLDCNFMLEAMDKISKSPNGNGGWFYSLRRAGLLKDIKQMGIEWLNIFAIDNVLQRIADPCFIGATIQHNCEAGAKVIKKASPTERIGVVCRRNGRPSIVEYYEMTDAMIHERDAAGNLAYQFGVILNYLFQVEKLEQIADRNIPLHIIKRKVDSIDCNGNVIKPDQENGYKLETLVLDQIEMMDHCLMYEIEREREFAPIKNMNGIDSIDTARELLKKNGVSL